MQTLLFIHGIGVRGDAWLSSLDLISRKAKRFLPDFEVAGCRWGDPFGALLHRGGATIPDYGKTGHSEDVADDASLARWFLLANDPLLELRITPQEDFFGEAGPEIFQLVSGLHTNDAPLRLVQEWSLAEAWLAFLAKIAADTEWRQTVEAITLSPAAASERVARAVTAAFQRELRELAFPSLSGAQRDELKDALVSPLGGPGFGVIGEWFKQRLTNFGSRRRGSLSDATTPAVGDVIRYQARGQLIRNFIGERVRQTGATIILAHSLGGVAAVDWLASPEYEKEFAGGKNAVKHLITAGSQSPYFYEIDALVSRTFGSGLPRAFPKKWLNFYDGNDFLSYKAEPVFSPIARDIEVDNGQPFPESHSAYWNNDNQVWKAIAAFLQEG